jgi:hypothetical protein
METKKCKICGVELTGRRTKYCSKESDKDKRKYYASEWAKNNKKANSIRNKKHYSQNKKKIIKQQGQYHKQKRKENKIFSLKENIRAQTNKKNKQIKKKCEFCGDKNNLQFHHFKYSFPISQNDFIVVCKKCHGKLHNYIQ